MSQVIKQLSFTDFLLCVWENTRKNKIRFCPQEAHHLDGEIHETIENELNAKL